MGHPTGLWKWRRSDVVGKCGGIAPADGFAASAYRSRDLSSVSEAQVRPGPARACGGGCRRVLPPTPICRRVSGSARGSASASCDCSRRPVTVDFNSLSSSDAAARKARICCCSRRPMAACTSRASREPPWKAKFTCIGTAMPKLCHNMSVAAGLASASAVVHHNYGIVAVAKFGYPGSMAGGNLYRTSQGAAQRLSDPSGIGHGTDDQDTMLHG